MDIRKIIIAFKILLSTALLIGTVRVWLLTKEAILDSYSWCGTPSLMRHSKIMLYCLLAPPALFAVILTWKNISKLDYVTKVTCIIFLFTMILYWFFEEHISVVMNWLV